jgi:hypothetical protein
MEIAQLDLNKIESTALPNFKFGGGGSNIGDIISQFLPLLFTFAGLILLVFLIWGGLQLMLSRGDQKAAGEAKSKITSALIGFILVFFAYLIVQFIGAVFGLQGIKNIFGS